ncbi:hypothetical protein A3C23_04805 [Candidatus Roizmanbacteria bacterium RIFCSPHIGHO2_02_FULL_37_13b]|uniref:Uncharacterized protein n=1 Tax=Candidatus Roizmanbacteria bacterium RIFCSPLOWO2_02_FULL_36_11 TaxID=1802071 RepID=A0A1F7JID7_9BACT|nr:MAG: hypothetical protein A3C23_04805 [Candidatus Roizmanbacteria bacterium RIFCSPHIGHO2_02_FULL_37_13b]OGK55372.1 MAG: hypothetical protein A3H78_03660 [Candidatus Roizmanbacteria bacterium RIFCSPLOWO2_02_FULL_36_11]
MTSQKLYDLETDVASLLLDRLEKEQITLQRAAQISKYILRALPDTITDEQIDKILPILDDEFVELSNIVHKHLMLKQELDKDLGITEAEKLIHEGKLQQSIDLMNNYITQKAL